MENKRGIYQLLFSVPVLIFAGIVLLLTFIFIGGVLSFLKNNLFVILAVGLSLGGVIFLLRPGGNQKFKTTIFLVLISVAVLFAFGGGILEQTFGGTSVLSISSINIEDQGEKIVVLASAGFGADELIIDWSAEEITNKVSDEGYVATKGVSGSLQIINSVVSFPIIKQTDNNYEHTIVKQINSFSGGCDGSNNKPAGYNTIGKIPSTSIKTVCLYVKPIGTNSVFTGQVIDKSRVSVNIDGATATLQPSAGENIKVLNDGKTEIKWVGNLMSSVLTLPPTNAILFEGSEFKKLIDGNSFGQVGTAEERYASDIESSASTLEKLSILLLFFGNPSFSTIDTANNNFNTKIGNLLADRTSDYKNNVDAQSVGFTSSSMEVELKTATSFPVFTITLDAESVGLRRLEGEPQILNCAENTEFFSGDIKNAEFLVENKGSEGGQFTGTVKGSSSVDQLHSQSLFLDAGDIATFSIQISGTNTESGTQNNVCDFTVTDLNSQVSDSCNFDCDVKFQPNIVCTPNSVKCISGNKLQTCNSEGSAFTNTQCSDDEVCKVADDGTGSCDIPKQCSTNSDCKSNEECKANICVPITITKQCSSFEELIDINKTYKKGFLSIFGIGKEVTETFPVCKLKDTYKWAIIGAIVFGLGLTAILVNRPKRRSSKRRR